MIEANRAYALGDEEQLRIILQAWETKSRSRAWEAIPTRCACGSFDGSRRSRRSWTCSPATWRRCRTRRWGSLKAMVDEAAAEGKDLVRDMIGRLKRDILVATNRLDAMRPPPA